MRENSNRRWQCWPEARDLNNRHLSRSEERTKDINRALRVTRAVETGRMWVNNYNSLPTQSPFGGYKNSGIGRKTHKMMLEHYSQKKNIFISLSEEKTGLY